jgi:hypothetical protein
MSVIDPATIARWFETYARPLVLYARQWGDGIGAKDVLQDVFVRLMRQAVEPDDVAVSCGSQRDDRLAAVKQTASRSGKARAENLRPGTPAPHTVKSNFLSATTASQPK